MSSGGNGKAIDQDFIAEGFHKVDHVSALVKAPKIAWGAEYLKWPLEKQLRYTQKLAAAQNQSAMMIQDERDELNRLIALKEKQLTIMSNNMKQNSAMLQSEVTKMNEYRQQVNAASAKANARIRDLERDLKEARGE